MATARIKTVKPPPLPKGAGPTQLDRVNAAIAHLQRFDKYWLEKLEEALAATRDPTADDKSVNKELWVLAETLLKRAKDWNLLRSHPSFPKSFVGE
jgi:hypothetical protein